MRSARFVLAFGLVALAFASGCAPRSGQPKANESARAASGSAHRPAVEHLDGYKLPLDVPTLEARLGKPTAIQRPAVSDPSPWGQWLTWKRSDGTTLCALADDYSSRSTDSSASVRYIELRAVPQPDSSDVVYTDAVYGFVLNQTDIWAVDATLTTSVPSMMHDRPELDPDDLYRASILYERDGIYTYFFFGDAGMLVGVGQATFPMDGAD